MAATDRERYSSQEVSYALEKLSGWSVADGKLHREYKFADFVTAFGFMAMAAPLIEKLNHHPEWSNVYGTVVVDLVTHSAGGITPMDVKLAEKLEGVAKRLL